MKNIVLCFLLAVAIVSIPTVCVLAGAPDGTSPPAAATVLPKLTPEELTILDNVTKVRSQADQDVQTARLFAEAAQAKLDRAILYEENQKLKLLAARKLSPDEYSVELQQVARNGTNVLEWALVKKTPPK